MDPELQALSIQLGETAVRNTASTLADRIRGAKARKEDRETISELEEMINNLLSDKSDLVRIAQAYEQELVAQRISDSDVQYISDNFIPVLRELVEAAEPGEDTSTVEQAIDLLAPLLSVETVTVLQLVGFNFKDAIGAPLTKLVGDFISSQAPTDKSQDLEFQRLAIQRELAYLQVAQDADAHARLQTMQGRGA